MLYDSEHVQYRVTSGWVSIVADDLSSPAFWAHPESGAKFPGIVVIHDDRGLGPRTRTWIRRFSEAGFYVIAPDLFDGRTATTPKEADALRESLGHKGLGRIAAAIEVLRNHHRCTGRIAVLGWQLGGELAYQAAVEFNDLAAAVVFYANPIHVLETMDSNQTPMLAFYGDNDPAVPMTLINRLSAAISESPGDEQLVVYPDIGADFLDEESPNFHPRYAAKTWKRLIDFLLHHLQVPPPAESTDAGPNEPEVDRG